MPGADGNDAVHHRSAKNDLIAKQGMVRSAILSVMKFRPCGSGFQPRYYRGKMPLPQKNIYNFIGNLCEEEVPFMEVRRYITIVEEILEEGGRTMEPAGKRAAAIAVIKNPFAGKYVEDLTPLIDIGDKLGGILGKMAVDALGIEPEAAENYGKAAIVGEAGEREHAAAILHPKLGSPFRSAVAGGKSLIPSAKKVGGMGTEIDVPLNYKDAAFVRSHFDAMAVRVPDAPRADEIVVALVVTNCGRPHPRIDGLKMSEAKKEDGLR
jgi:hypothetical protein